MKKIFLTTLIAAMIGSQVFASDVSKVSYRVLTAFQVQFTDATDVNWTVTEDYSKAKFTIEGEQVEAFFNASGDMIGTSRKTDLKRLPLNAIQKIRKSYGKYKVTETIEFEFNGERKYFVSLENDADRKILEVSLYGNVTIFEKSK
ncbi:MAG: hypothetical protein U1C70_13645 [Sediminibacterium sp.]|jgi:hypothetical protein|uniref:hypothetical protein n=1 Tax=Sediminibacterium sp. TaxID=1917865 RepID=UPI002AB9649F|nr:hypothetical protein [Sediminibacterium sp.]MDZ4072864.1 hypothetical protein [Sediminibacterium sp.]